LGKGNGPAGDKECKRQWHGKKCREWNRKNRSYFQEIYLEKCLASCEPPDNNGSTKPLDEAVSVSLPAIPVQEVNKRSTIGNYKVSVATTDSSISRVIKKPTRRNKRNCRRLPVITNSRGDGQAGVNPVS